MFDIYFMVGLFVFSILCFFEIIVFNEEILLTLCFFSFIFFCFNTLSGSVLDAFVSRGSKFEADLLSSFHQTKNSLFSDFDEAFKLRGFFPKFKIFLSSILLYLGGYKKYLTIKIASTIYNIGFAKINELVLANNRLAVGFQNNCIIKLLYPLIYQTVEYNLSSSIVSGKPKTTKYVGFLKTLSSK